MIPYYRALWRLCSVALAEFDFRSWQCGRNMRLSQLACIVMWGRPTGIHLLLWFKLQYLFEFSSLRHAIFGDFNHIMVKQLRWLMWGLQNLTHETNIFLLPPLVFFLVFFAMPLCWHLTTAVSSTWLYLCSLNNTSQIIMARMDCK